MKKLAAWFWHWPTSAKFALAALVLFAVFAFFNDTTATIHLGFGRVEMPHYVALLVAAVFGFAPGVWFGIAFARREAARRAATAASAAAEEASAAKRAAEEANGAPSANTSPPVSGA
jgi:uncharacterized integral membrane protein